MKKPVTESAFYVTVASSKFNFSEYSFYEPTLFLALKRLHHNTQDDRSSLITFTIDRAEPPVHSNMTERHTRLVEGVLRSESSGYVARRVKLAVIKPVRRATVEKMFKRFESPCYVTESFLNANG